MQFKPAVSSLPGGAPGAVGEMVMATGHLVASRLDCDTYCPPQDPSGLVLGPGRMWEGGMTRFQKAKESEPKFSTLSLQKITETASQAIANPFE